MKKFLSLVVSFGMLSSGVGICSASTVDLTETPVVDPTVVFEENRDSQNDVVVPDGEESLGVEEIEEIVKRVSKLSREAAANNAKAKGLYAEGFADGESSAMSKYVDQRRNVVVVSGAMILLSAALSAAVTSVVERAKSAPKRK